jgi:hypothetical protein
MKVELKVIVNLGLVSNKTFSLGCGVFSISVI